MAAGIGSGPTMNGLFVRWSASRLTGVKVFLFVFVVATAIAGAIMFAENSPKIPETPPVAPPPAPAPIFTPPLREEPEQVIYERAEPVPDDETAIISVSTPIPAVAMFEKYELSLRLATPVYVDPFDGNSVELIAQFISPRGRQIRVRGFFYEWPENGVEAALWKIRFAPDEVGHWVFDLRLTTSQGDDTSSLLSFDCKPGAESGFARVSRGDRRYFELSDGEFFYPLGANIAWAGTPQDMERYLRDLAANGGNVARVWLCPWHMPIEIAGCLGRYDLDAARSWDAFFETARARGIRVQWVLQYHGMLGDSWSGNPYNAANGGPCREPRGFFVNPRARLAYKRFLDYVAARWAHETALFAWEMWNEVDLTPGAPEEIAAWHNEMCEHLRAADPYNHPITTSFSQHEGSEELLEMRALDFFSPHIYSEWLEEDIPWMSAWCQSAGRPCFIGEFSQTADKPSADYDLQGRSLLRGLWLSVCSPASGAAMPWWWDVHIDANDLWKRYAGPAAFVAGLDRRELGLIAAVSRLDAGEGRIAVARGAVSSGRAYIFIYSDAPPVLARASRLCLKGMLAGNYRVEIWDAVEGTIVNRGQLSAREGELRIGLPRAENELAVKVERMANDSPRLTP